MPIIDCSATPQLINLSGNFSLNLTIEPAGEISATADFTVMYDSNTAGLFETFNNQTAGASQGATLMNHQASLADANIGFKFTGSALTNVAFSEGSLMMIDCSVKALGSGIGSSTALVEVAC